MDDVDQEIQENDQSCIEEHGAEDHGVVTVEGGCDEKASQTGYEENGFDDEGYIRLSFRDGSVVGIRGSVLEEKGGKEAQKDDVERREDLRSFPL